MHAQVFSHSVSYKFYFPDSRLIQFECGKMQGHAILLRRLKSDRHRALIFTQITKMLDAFKEFINLYGYTYFHLDIAHQSREDEEHKG